MGYSIELKVTITEHPDENNSTEIAETYRSYDVVDLTTLPQVVSHFGRAVTSLVEGRKLGEDQQS